jgi:fructosamine-3-kinase
VTSARDLSEFACHPCAILAGQGFAAFAKFSDAPNGLEQFETERQSLATLTGRAGVLTPPAVGALAVEGGALLVLEAMRAVKRGPREWRAIGEALARMHQVRGERFGLETDGAFGPLHLDNRPLDDWPTFYAERRLRPYLRLAVDAGRLPAGVAAQVERLIGRLPELCGPTVAPTLLHGDAQQNNFISTAAGAVAIDPAIYYGHPEVDLALVDYFEPVPAEVFDGYRAERPIDAGFAGRRDLWRAHAYLACVAVDGAAYLGRLVDALSTYQ